MTAPTRTRVPDHIASLRDSFALHLEATRRPAAVRIYLAALDGLIFQLEQHGAARSWTVSRVYAVSSPTS